MAKTYSQLQKQIEALQKEADNLRKKEIAGVVSRIREAIDHYQLTAADLFPAKPGRKPKAATTSTAAKPAKAAGKKSASPAKYRDPASGKTWTGRGKRPDWYKAALAAGKAAQELEIKG